MSDSPGGAGDPIHIYAYGPKATRTYCGGSGDGVVAGVGGMLDTATCEACIDLHARGVRPSLNRQTTSRPVREGDTVGRAGRNGVKPARAREMTAEDRRRVTLGDDGIHDSGIESVTIPAPPADGRGLRRVTIEDEHQSILHLDGKGEPRVPESFETALAKERAAVFARDRKTTNADLRSERDRMPLHKRLAALVHAISTLQTPRAKAMPEPDEVRAASPAAMRVKSDSSGKPTEAGTLPRLAHGTKGSTGATSGAMPSGDDFGAIGWSDPADFDRDMEIVKRLVEKWEGRLDAHRGHCDPVDFDTMSPEQLNRVITGPQFRNVHVRDLAVIHPRLGSSSTLRRVRSGAGQDVMGNPKPDPQLERERLERERAEGPDATDMVIADIDAKLAKREPEEQAA